MKQNIVKSVNALSNLGANVVGGLTQYEAALHISHVPKVKVEADLLALLTGRDAYEAGRLVLSDRRDTLRAATKEGRDLVIVTRDTFKPRWGGQYSSVWDVLGFADSLGAPSAPDEVKPMVRAINAYLTANATYEIPGLGITAAHADTIYNAIVAAEIAVNLQETTLGNLRNARDAAAETLYGSIRSLVDELNLAMGPLDERWLAFGLNKPGAEATPDMVTGVRAALVGPTAAAVKWEAPARASYYRVWYKIHGSAADYATVGSPADLDFTIENLPANSAVDIVVTALNDGGESAFSLPITIATHG